MTTLRSVTETPCTCRYLEHAADDPEMPIVWNEQVGEFQFRYGRRGREMLIIYHCPFCGGAAPKSKRELLFAQIPPKEEARLAALLQSVTTIDDCIAALGQPDEDQVDRMFKPEDDNEPPRIEYPRRVVYSRLSKVALVEITERPDGSAFWQLVGKPIA
jgi:hypothetical protein